MADRSVDIWGDLYKEIEKFDAEHEDKKGSCVLLADYSKALDLSNQSASNEPKVEGVDAAGMGFSDKPSTKEEKETKKLNERQIERERIANIKCSPNVLPAYSDDIRKKLLSSPDKLRDFIKEFSTFKTLYEKESGGVLWKTIRPKIIKNQWKEKCNQELRMFPGYVNGDPTNVKAQAVGNSGDIHALGVGGTGAGKSVFLNYTIAQLCLNYSPEDLELWLTDFKGVEFKYYLPSKRYNYMYPHIKACLCTTDPDFAASLFEALDEENLRRFNMLKDNGFKNLKDWNEFKEKEANSSKYDNDPEGRQKILSERLTRILFVCDEFQVIFQKGDPDNIQKIKKALTSVAKLGRASGVHMLFTSQSMDKTLPDDVLNQFTLRYCLRCAKDTSQQILGCSLAGDITQRNGLLYVANLEKKGPDAVLHSTPFINDSDKEIDTEDEKAFNNYLEKNGYTPTSPEVVNNTFVDEKLDDEGNVISSKKVILQPSELRLIIKECADAAKQHPEWRKHTVISYEEDHKHPIKEIGQFYEDNKDNPVIPDSGLILIGPYMKYSSNNAPDNFILGAGDKEHIFSLFNTQVDLVSFYTTIIENRKGWRNPGRLFINCQDENLISLLKPEEDVPDEIMYPTDADGNRLKNPDGTDVEVKMQYTPMISPKNYSVSAMIEFIQKQFNDRKALREEYEREGKKFTPSYFLLIGWDKSVDFGLSPNVMLIKPFADAMELMGELDMHVIFICTTSAKIKSNITGACKHFVVGKCSSDDSFTTLNSKIASVSTSLDNGYCFHLTKGNPISKDKLYQCNARGSVRQTSIVL